LLVTAGVLTARADRDADAAVGRVGTGHRVTNPSTTAIGRRSGNSAEPARVPFVRRSLVIGHSVRGLPIVAVELGNPTAPRRVLIVGCIHGDEPAGIAIARALERRHPPPSVQLSVIEDLNPDGVAAGTRQNAHYVDLNRNFPDAWRPIGRPGDEQYSGTAPLSEPEARAAAAFLNRVRPTLTIWFHQRAGVVDESGGDLAVEARFAQAIGLPLRRLTRYPGSVATWENNHLAGSTAFVVELPAGAATPIMIRRAADAALN
jgi:protein MpaA